MTTTKNGWKKSELALKSHGYYDLAAAVCRQWKLDGYPSSDYDGIRLWAALIQQQQKVVRGVVIPASICDNSMGS